jgi:hypothetical protein
MNREHCNNRFACMSALLVFFSLLACIVTWPLILHLQTHLPLGAETSATVPLFNLWTLRWNVDQLRAGYLSYWDAPIFFPVQGAFALSEPQPLTGLLFALLDILTRNDTLAYNVLLLLILTLNGMAAFFLLTILEVPRGAALLGGMLAVRLPFVFDQLGVIQLTVVFPLLMTFATLALFAHRPHLGTALALGGWIAVTFLTCGYYGLFLSLFLLLGGCILVQRRHLHREPIGQLLIGLAFACLLVLPVLPAQAQRTAGYTRSAETIIQNSAQLVDYLHSNPQSWHVLPWQQLAGGSGETLYPGVGLVLLTALGVGIGWKGGQRRWLLFSVAGATIALLLSLGLNLTIGGWAPYALLRTYYPGFQQLRSPFRFGLFVQLYLLILASYGLRWLWIWRAPLGRWLAISATILSLLELLIVPASLYRVPVERLHARWINWLATQPPGAVAMVPFPPTGRASDYEATTIAMLQALNHRKPLING